MRQADKRSALAPWGLAGPCSFRVLPPSSSSCHWKCCSSASKSPGYLELDSWSEGIYFGKGEISGAGLKDSFSREIPGLSYPSPSRIRTT